jgi:hypothetical protein
MAAADVGMELVAGMVLVADALGALDDAESAEDFLLLEHAVIASGRTAAAVTARGYGGHSRRS